MKPESFERFPGRPSPAGGAFPGISTLPPEEEFVFGQFTSPQLGVTTQVPIRAIAARSGILFRNLADFDPLDAADELSEGRAAQTPLAGVSQIRFA